MAKIGPLNIKFGKSEPTTKSLNDILDEEANRRKPRPTRIQPYNLFGDLLPFSWKDAVSSTAVQFPVHTMSVSLQQDLAVHSIWGQDAERYEGTGRKSLVFRASIPFRNSVRAAKTEEWAGTLYPSVYRRFIVMCASGATGTLTHPEFGEIECKVRSVESHWDANKRDGCDVEVDWVETLPKDGDGKTPGGGDLGTSTAEFEAGSLDTFMHDSLAKSVAAARPDIAEPGLLDAMNAVAKIGDKVSLLEGKYYGKIDAVMYRLDRIEDSSLRPLQTANSILNRATLRVKQQGDRVQKVQDLITPNKTGKALASLGWPTRRSIGKMRAALQGLREKLLASGKPIIFYRVARGTTLAGLVPITGASLNDLIVLNPAAMATPVIHTGTLIRYYAKG